MGKSTSEGIHIIEFHSLGNQTTWRNLVNEIDHSNSTRFSRIPANQTPPNTSSFHQTYDYRYSLNRLNFDATSAPHHFFLFSTLFTITQRPKLTQPFFNIYVYLIWEGLTLQVYLRPAYRCVASPAKPETDPLTRGRYGWPYRRVWIENSLSTYALFAKRYVYVYRF